MSNVHIFKYIFSQCFVILPKEQHQRTKECLEIVVLINVAFISQFNIPKHLKNEEDITVSRFCSVSFIFMDF